MSGLGDERGATSTCTSNRRSVARLVTGLILTVLASTALAAPPASPQPRAGDQGYTRVFITVFPDFLLSILYNLSLDNANDRDQFKIAEQFKSKSLSLKRTPQAGALTSVPSPALPNCPAKWAIVLAPDLKYIYVANGDICAYAYDAATNVATPVPGSPFHVGAYTSAIARDPSGSYLVAVNQDSRTVNALKVDPTTGKLTDLPGSPAPIGAEPLSVAVDGVGRFVYAPGSADSTITAY
ncbi:MAG TPA: beta-propeller fold lactonase family protein, partial [Casimicrobiaceae bacterium]|nr:beta-propeller fold lactonase family protein [Casimicrobiaceae bacterium]